ncbi:MAG: hypothetical protein AAGA28_03975 [Pseudomonadota bacterium]
MKLFTTVCASLAVVTAMTAFTTPASAQSAQDVLPLTTDDIEKARTWGKWQILRNKTRGHCLGTKSDDSGVVQMGVTADETMGYVGVFVKQDVEAGESDEIVIEVGGETFVGESSGPVGGLGDGWHGGYVLANNQNFRKAIEASDTMVAFPDAPYAVVLNIAGSGDAIYEIAKCSRELAG